MTNKRRFAISAAIVLYVFCCMDLLLFVHAHFYSDFPRSFGFPVPAYSDSIWGGRQLSFLAIPIDVLALLALAAIVFFAWKRLDLHPNTLRYSAGIFASISLFAILNCLDFLRPHVIIDGIYRHGIPFTFYRYGGFQHEHTHIWIGLVIDFFIAIITGMASAQFWVSFTKRKFHTD